MAFLPTTKLLLSSAINSIHGLKPQTVLARNLTSKQLVYSEFGDPLNVVKYRECQVPPVGPMQVLVRMLAAPVNPADINTIQGKNRYRPALPNIPGHEGVGRVVEIGCCVSTVKPGQRVILSTMQRGTWRYYGIFHERDVHVVSSKLPLGDLSMIMVSPCTAYRMLRDFRKLETGQTVIQNAPTSPVGQCVIQLCKAWGIHTVNIVPTLCCFETVKERLLSLGASEVYTLEEASRITEFTTSLTRPIFGLNCLGCPYDSVLVRLMRRCADVVYYGSAYDVPFCVNQRPDLSYHKFTLSDWDKSAPPHVKTSMINDVLYQLATGHLRAPLHEPIEFSNYIKALKYTQSCEAFSIGNYVFDFTFGD